MELTTGKAWQRGDYDNIHLDKPVLNRDEWSMEVCLDDMKQRNLPVTSVTSVKLNNLEAKAFRIGEWGLDTLSEIALYQALWGYKNGVENIKEMVQNVPEAIQVYKESPVPFNHLADNMVWHMYTYDRKVEGYIPYMCQLLKHVITARDHPAALGLRQYIQGETKPRDAVTNMDIPPPEQLFSIPWKSWAGKIGNAARRGYNKIKSLFSKKITSAVDSVTGIIPGPEEEKIAKPERVEDELAKRSENPQPAPVPMNLNPDIAAELQDQGQGPENEIETYLHLRKITIKGRDDLKFMTGGKPEDQLTSDQVHQAFQRYVKAEPEDVIMAIHAANIVRIVLCTMDPKVHLLDLRKQIVKTGLKLIDMIGEGTRKIQDDQYFYCSPTNKVYLYGSVPLSSKAYGDLATYTTDQVWYDPDNTQGDGFGIPSGPEILTQMQIGGPTGYPCLYVCVARTMEPVDIDKQEADRKVKINCIYSKRDGEPLADFPKQSPRVPWLKPKNDSFVLNVTMRGRIVFGLGQFSLPQ